MLPVVFTCFTIMCAWESQNRDNLYFWTEHLPVSFDTSYLYVVSNGFMEDAGNPAEPALLLLVPMG